MNAKIIGQAVSSLLVFTMLVLTGSANAAPLFTATDLGSSYQLQTDSNGYVHGVTNAEGTSTYRFDKLPVHYNTASYGLEYQYGEGRDLFVNSQGSSAFYEVASNQFGQIRFHVLDHGGYPVRTSFGSLKYVNPDYSRNYWSIPGGTRPVEDFKSSGQVVGQITLQLSLSGPTSIAAAFSDKNFTTHGHATIPHTNSDDLNNYLASDLGIHLTSAMRIDDSGQIIAAGVHDGKIENFLLTPNGPPTVTPEPSALAVLICALAGIGVRSVSRRSGNKNIKLDCLVSIHSRQ